MIQKIFEKINKEHELTEYEKTVIHDRTLLLRDKIENKDYVLNQNGDMRLIESFDSTCKTNSYVNELRNRNRNRITQTMNGFQNSTCDILVGFQVKGKNQLFKEIEEINHTSDKKLDLGAIHRNEKTMEIEGELS